MRAMVIEDSIPNQRILSLTLSKMGFEVESFGDGAAAWTRLQEEPGSWSFVFSDIMMPKMDGIELLKKVRSHQQLKELQVFLVTAVADKQYVIEAKNLNANGYIVKPISYSKILAKVQPLFPDRAFPAAS